MNGCQWHLINLNMSYNNLYQQDKNVWEQNPNKLLKLIWQKVKPGVFLDLGSGQGRDALFMTRQGFKVIAVDSSEVVIKQIQKIIKQNNLKNIQAIRADVLDFKIEENKYDIINGNNVLQFLPKDKALALIKDIQQKIKPDGFIILSSFTTDDPSYQLSPEKRFASYFKPQEMLKLFHDFKIIYYLEDIILDKGHTCLLYTSPSPRDLSTSRMPSSA